MQPLELGEQQAMSAELVLRSPQTSSFVPPEREGESSLFHLDLYLAMPGVVWPESSFIFPSS